MQEELPKNIAILTFLVEIAEIVPGKCFGGSDIQTLSLHKNTVCLVHFVPGRPKKAHVSCARKHCRNTHGTRVSQ